MKQTVEEAAMQELMLSYAIVVEGELAYQRQAMLNMFKKGADWQSKQSPWISMEERLPEDTNEKLVALEDGTIRIAHYDEDYNEDMEYHFWYDCAASESYHRDDVIYWMPIPSFDEILEANKDVLQRMK
nr:MAG TPA: Protein of unknown function (DUF551) [Caudoviricetes sp.]